MAARNRSGINELIERWRARHEARVAAEGRPPADADREARADRFFPWRTESAAEYAATHGSAMAGFTYDAYTYSDPALEAWLRELGQLLRARERRC
jgi:hypothetical protein